MSGGASLWKKAHDAKRQSYHNVAGWPSERWIHHGSLRPQLYETTRGIWLACSHGVQVPKVRIGHLADQASDSLF